MSTARSIVWFRQDLRLADHPALTAAAARGAVVPVFIWSPGEEGEWPAGGASRWWLHQSLDSLANSLKKRGVSLILRRGPALGTLRALAHETDATAVFWNRRYEPAAIARDTKIKAELQNEGLECESFNGGLLHEPWEVQTGEGKPYRVFTPYYRACLGRGAPAEPLPVPRSLRGVESMDNSESLTDFSLLPRIDWARGLRDAWTPGERGAAAELERFAICSAQYATDRDNPALNGTSRLSPFLHFGEISPRQIWRIVSEIAEMQSAAAAGASAFLRELIWREFAHHLLYHFPTTPTEPLRAEFAKFPWQRDVKLLRAWQRGETGYPLVDAGMRQLWHTGWMHNRVRMVAASFLVKHLLQPWQDGAKWFWDTLVDADLANNTLGWQWTAGCGADAAPFFRIFNPTTQQEKFDPRGDYVRRWLATPSAAPQSEQIGNAGNTIHPIVDHKQARERALAAFARIRER